jgi:hypothetical protein
MCSIDEDELLLSGSPLVLLLLSLTLRVIRSPSSISMDFEVDELLAMLLLESSLCIPLIAFSAADVPTIFVEKTFCSIFFLGLLAL